MFSKILFRLTNIYSIECGQGLKIREKVTQSMIDNICAVKVTTKRHPLFLGGKTLNIHYSRVEMHL